ncbi:MAG: bifunctional diaminohydroxyphosphoribosylaminopyrimidine deaminase/5-amino-6-(5-phosphoribosylamino)uracil reductase RibD [Alphaproteobacteria bacterium]
MEPGPSDQRHMAHAIALAARGLGRTWPNPPVGCVIVSRADGGIVVGRGNTAPGGRPHAETIALAQAKTAARGASAYVTLEPCAHHGQTPPCATALVEAGIARVFIACKDRDPRVSGAGAARLAAAGVAVNIGCGAGAAAKQLAGFFSRLERGRPQVLLKLAISADGMIAAAPGQATQITGARAKARTHMMRAQADAIMVGARTWAIDDPELTCRLPGLEDRSPVRVVVDARAQLPLGSALVRTSGSVPLWVMVGRDAPLERRRALAAAGAEIVEIAAIAGGHLDPGAMLAALAGRGITRLMVEGGAKLAQSFIKARLVDEFAVFRASRQIGPGGVPALGAGSLAATLAGQFDLEFDQSLGADRLELYTLAKDPSCSQAS